jgi:hypothetical protein
MVALEIKSYSFRRDDRLGRLAPLGDLSPAPDGAHRACCRKLAKSVFHQPACRPRTLLTALLFWSGRRTGLRCHRSGVHHLL